MKNILLIFLISLFFGTAFADKLCGCSFPTNIFPNATKNCYQPCVGFGSLSCEAWGNSTGLTCVQLSPSCSGGTNTCNINPDKARCYLRYSMCMSTSGQNCCDWAGPDCASTWNCPTFLNHK